MPTTNSVRATLQIRHDIASNWTTRNPILAQGEYALETNTGYLKIGDGSTPWNELPYLNKIDTAYFQYSDEDGITFSDEFLNTIAALEAAAGQAIENLQITEPPVGPYDVPNKQYVDDAIAGAHHLRREIVLTLPSAVTADPDTLYMVLAQSGDHYEEYMVVNGAWDMVGTTGDGGSSGQYQLPVATTARLGGVKASTLPDQINVTQEGFMTLNQVSTSKLYVPTGDVLVLYGGSA